MKNHFQIRKMILAALFLALAYAMPFLTGQIPQIGAMLCPMHIPILLCGFLCGWPWGLTMGFLAPVLRSMMLGTPPLFPVAVSMAFELAAYGAVSGLMHRLLPHKKCYIYCSLLSAMILGRLAWGAAMFVCVGLQGATFTLTAFLVGAVANAFPGIVVQLALVPAIVMLLDNPKVVSAKS